MEVSRTAVFPDASRHKDPIQADVDRCRVGCPAAGAHDADLHGYLQHVRPVRYKRRPIPFVRVERLDRLALCPHVDLARMYELRQQHESHYESLLSASYRSDRVGPRNAF